jgi:hypothetical protein
MKHSEAFLKKIGVKADILNQLSSEEDVNIDDLAKSWKTSFKDVVANDPDFIQPIKDEIQGTILGKVEHKLKKTFGLAPEEIKDKKFDEIIALSYEKATKSMSSTSDELQAKMVELTKENKRLMEEVIPAKESEAINAIKNFKKQTSIRTILGQKALVVNPDVVLPALEQHLNSSFAIDLDDQDKFVVKTKNGLNPLNEDGTKVMSFDEILDGYLGPKGLNVLKQSNGGQTPPAGQASRPKFESQEGKPSWNLPGMKAAQENAEHMKNIRTFGQ